MVSADGPVWGDFQSVVQLSVALNVAYATLYTFIAASLDQGKWYVTNSRDEKELDDIHAKSLSSFKRGILNIDVFINRFGTSLLRPISALFSIFGFALLVFSSFKAHMSISVFWSRVCYVLALPFFITMAVYLVFSVVIVIRSRIFFELRRADENSDT
jgi:hypothetical protein